MLKIKGKVNDINSLVKEFENNTNELSVDIKIFETEFQLMEESKPEGQPCEEIRLLLTKWLKETHLPSGHELDKFAVSLLY